MRIAQIILDGASLYERKAQRLDADALRAAGHDVVLAESGTVPAADIAHVYGPPTLPARPFFRFAIPYIASGEVTPSRLWFRRAVPPRAVLSPVARDGAIVLPEAVDDRYFARMSRVESDVRRIGSYAAGRPHVQSMIDRTRIRLERTRTDIEWEVFPQEPTPDDFARLDAWIDPVVDHSDYDGYVGEAAASGRVIVAARTPMNAARLEQGRTGFLVPVNDPNETTHAILAALFRTESAQQKQQAATQTISKFRVRQRLRALLRIYESALHGK